MINSVGFPHSEINFESQYYISALALTYANYQAIEIISLAYNKIYK